MSAPLVYRQIACGRLATGGPPMKIEIWTPASGRVEEALAGNFFWCPTALLWETPIHIQHSHSKLWATNSDTLNPQLCPIGLFQHALPQG